MRNRNLAASLFGLLTFGVLLISARNEPQASRDPIPGAANPQNNLGGRMPPSFDRDVARVVADIDRIEADTLSQMDRTTSIAKDRSGPWESYCSSISASRSIRTKHAVS